MRPFISGLFLSAAIFALSACGSTEQQDPVGIGSGTDEFKRSPCACLEIEQPDVTPEYLKSLGNVS